MPTPTYTPLANITLGSSAASVTFSSINQGFRDLVIVASAVGTSTANVNSRINNDTGSNYSWVTMGGDGSTTISQNSGGTTTVLLLNERSLLTTSNRLGITMHVLDYSATDKHKTLLVRSGNAVNGADALSHRWASSAAVTTLQIYPGAGSFAAGSTFALYGIAA